MAVRIAVVNEKGGVGKTTTATNLAVAFAKRGRRTLLVDCDPQRSASKLVGLVSLSDSSDAYGTSDLYLGSRAFAPQRNVLVPGLDVVPATRKMFQLELELMRHMLTGPTTKLARQIGVFDKEYDFIVADCGPTLGLVTVNAMIACPSLVVPLKPEPASTPGVVDLTALVEQLKEAEPSLRVMGLLVTLFQESAKLPGTYVRELREQFGSLVFESLIHQAVAVAESAGPGVPIVLSDPTSRAAREYESLAAEVIHRGA